ncbi:MAG: hypothetical protein H0U59_12920 [Gemmatimonadaceae bacterium]|nr:hypothetical protein [Gemmatimonadaceae bacterium]
MGRGIRSEDQPDVTIEGVEVTVATAKALLVTKDGKENWVPLSQLKDGTTVKKRGDKGRIILPAWLAKEKGWSEGESEDDE